LVRPSGRIRRTGRQQVQQVAGILLPVQRSKRFSDNLDDLLKQDAVERPVEEVLPVGVGLPGSIEDAGKAGFGFRGEKGPELAAGTPGLVRNSPEQRQGVTLLRLPVGVVAGFSGEISNLNIAAEHGPDRLLIRLAD